jgi:hypothetical protein
MHECIGSQDARGPRLRGVPTASTIAVPGGRGQEMSSVSNPASRSGMTSGRVAARCPRAKTRTDTPDSSDPAVPSRAVIQRVTNCGGSAPAMRRPRPSWSRGTSRRSCWRSGSRKLRIRYVWIGGPLGFAWDRGPSRLDPGWPGPRWMGGRDDDPGGVTRRAQHWRTRHGGAPPRPTGSYRHLPPLPGDPGRKLMWQHLEPSGHRTHITWNHKTHPRCPLSRKGETAAGG